MIEADDLEVKEGSIIFYIKGRIYKIYPCCNTLVTSHGPFPVTEPSIDLVKK